MDAGRASAPASRNGDEPGMSRLARTLAPPRLAQHKLKSPSFTPNPAAVIPPDAQGPVDNLLESSTNFVDWVQALPGTYGTFSQLRYFRVRAVRK